jgi:hypothetical protein
VVTPAYWRPPPFAYASPVTTLSRNYTSDFRVEAESQESVDAPEAGQQQEETQDNA